LTQEADSISAHTQSQPDSRPAETGILSRFAHLVSAQGLDSLANVAFFLYLAWLDSFVYGELMYSLAAASVVMKVIQFGLYYPLVAALGRSDAAEKSDILNRVNIIKLALFLPTMSFVVGFGVFKGFSTEMTLILILVCLGFGLDAFADTFFADLRVRGRQDQEARIKIAGSLLGYGFGFSSAAMGLHPVVISLFALISASVRLGFAIINTHATYSGALFRRPDSSAIWSLFRGAVTFALIEILGIVYNKTNIFFLEGATGVKGVAYYSATWNIVDPISTLASEQLLGWVIFPLLASLWWTNRDRVKGLVRGNAMWLMAIAFPIMLFLYAESDLLIGLIYPAEFSDAAWMQKYLVWTILLSFENNLFFYLMMVAGGANVLLLFTVIVTLLNLLFNWTLVAPYGLMGGCLVIILTKLTMVLLTFLYCQIRFRLFAPGNALFPLILAVVSLVIFVVSKATIGLHPAVAATILFYSVMIWRLGERFLGPLPTRAPAP